MISFNYILLLFILINLFFIINFNKLSFLHYILDKPDKKRKLHLSPVPLAGGIILITNILIYFLIINLNEEYLINEIFFNNKFELYVFFSSAVIIFFIGLIDDKYNLSPNLKFLLLSIILSLALIYDKNLVLSSITISFLDETINLNRYSLFFSCFCFLVFLNAFNMFDGINVQASSYSIIIFSFILILYSDSFLVKILLIYLIGYSFLNYKEKSFLGDSGSLLIAFMMGYLFIKLYNLEIIKYADEVFIFMIIPGLDLIRLFFKRILNKKNPLRPDRFHLHHLLRLKFTNIKSILIINIMIIAPLILFYIDVNKLFIILFTIFTYSLTIYNLEK